MRRLAKVIVLLSLLLCLAVAATALRSYWVMDYWMWASHPPEGRGVDIITTVHGALELARLAGAQHDGFPPTTQMHGSSRTRDALRPEPMPDARGGYGIHWQRPTPVPFAGGTTYRRLRISLWLIVPIFALPSALAAMLHAGRVHRRARRRRNGLCAACGYDLRGSGESTRCPECGAEVKPA